MHCRTVKTSPRKAFPRVQAILRSVYFGFVGSRYHRLRRRQTYLVVAKSEERHVGRNNFVSYPNVGFKRLLEDVGGQRCVVRCVSFFFSGPPTSTFEG